MWTPCIYSQTKNKMIEKNISKYIPRKRPASWSESLTTKHVVPGSIPGSTVGIFPEGEDSCRDRGLGRLVEFRFKGPPGTTSSYITTHIIGTT